MDPTTLVVSILLCIFGACAAQEKIRFRVKEEQPEGTLVGSLAEASLIKDAVSDDARSSLRYTFLSSEMSHASLFAINATSGVIRTAKPLDREALCGLYTPTCELTLEVAAQSGLTQFFRMATLTVEIEDVNDHAPEFPQPRVTLEISEDAAVNSTFNLAAAMDQDMGQNGVQGYSLAGPTGGPFVINVAEAQDGRQKVSLLVKSPLDREATPLYRLMVVAQDGGRPPRTGSMPVEISVLDVNDNPPVFHPASFNVSLDETTPLGTVVVTFNVTDADKEANGRRTFRFSPSMQPEVTKYFSLNSTTAQLRVAAPLTQIQGSTVQVVVECSDGGQPSLVGGATVLISVADSGNTRPRAILSLLFDGNVSEYAQPGTVVAHVRVIDPDQGLQGLVSCSVRSEALELQALDVDRYKVIVVRALDREQQSTHNVSVNCRDAGSPSLDTTVTFTVRVLDENDNAPHFQEDVYYANVMENNEIGLQVARVVANDPDLGENGEIDYSISSTSGDAGVIIDNSGYVIATRSFDHERNHQVTFDVIATDRGSPKRRSAATVLLTINDANDVTPTFKQDFYEVRVAENGIVGMTVGKVSADDTDSGENGRLSYSLVWENPRETAFYNPMDTHLPLAVSPNGILTLERELDHESSSEYSLLVLASDNGNPSRTGSARITVLVDDVNDNPPLIIVPDPSNVSALALATDTKPGSTLLVVVARDSDDPDITKLHYHLAKTASFIRINGENGVLTLSRKLGERDLGHHRVTVVVTDSGIPPKASNASFDLVVFTANATDSPSPGDRVEHLLIVIILGCVTGIITVAVIVTIVVIRRADQQRRKYTERDDMKPVGEKAAVELGSALIVTTSSPDTTMTKSHTGSRNSSKDGTIDEDSFPDKSFSGGSVSQESHHNASADDGQWTKALRLHQDLLKLHGVDPGVNRHFLLQPDDGNSDASGESTACDSGRGGSEEDSHSTGRISPSATDLRVAPGSKVPRHSTFHPAGVSRTIRCNPPLLRQQPHPLATSPLTSSQSSFHNGSQNSSSWTDNGNPVKKVSFHDDVNRKHTSFDDVSNRKLTSFHDDVNSRKPISYDDVINRKMTSFHDDDNRKQTSSPYHRSPASVDRWQSPVLIGGVAGDPVPPPAPQQPQYQNVAQARHHPYGSTPRRQYNNLSPRFDLEDSLDTMDDNASTTTSGSYSVDLESLPSRGRLSHASVDHHAVV